MRYRDLKVLDAANRAVDLVNELVERSPRGRLLHARQLSDAVQSIAANISEGFGRRPGPARNNSLDIARRETAEAIRHLGANFRGRRISRKDYWPIHNTLAVIGKMITSMLGH